MVQKTDNLPMWVYLAFSVIETRKGALWLIGSSVVFSVYCVPWGRIFTNQDWIMKIFLINDWSWFAMMIPVILWYWISLRWMDRNSKWTDSAHQKD
ncbi:MAG: hypothetical protein KKC46_10015 [Proteobacteria bacterium]|nr:hypothetical protein [Pseudomonadota bacterium]